MGKPRIEDHAYNSHWNGKFRCPSQGGVNRRFGKHRSRPTADTSRSKK